MDDFSENESNESPMMALLMKMNNKMDSMDNNQRQTADSIQVMRNEMHTKFDGIGKKFCEIDENLGKTNDRIDKLAVQLNALEQGKFANYIDITGIQADTIEILKNDPKALANQVFSYFGIKPTPNAIQSAFIRTTKRGMAKMLTVVISSTAEKYAIMKQKREWKGQTEIYFDHAMTPETRNLFFYARKKVKEGRFKSVFLRNNGIMIGQLNGSTVRVTSEDDVNRLAETVQQTPASNTPSTSNMQ